MIIKSIYDNQPELLNAIQALHLPEGYQCDVTYGNGGFWKNVEHPPTLCYDIQPLKDNVTKADFTSLPIKDDYLDNMVIDPPFLTYVRSGREGNGNMVMSKRFGGYWTYDELRISYAGALLESHRTLKKKGHLVFKCQDIVHNHKLECTHLMVVNLAHITGFRLKDLFILSATHRMPVRSDIVRTQRHARIYHSYFLVFQKC